MEKLFFGPACKVINTMAAPLTIALKGNINANSKKPKTTVNAGNFPESVKLAKFFIIANNRGLLELRVWRP